MPIRQVLVVLAALALIAFALCFVPLRPAGLDAHPRPAADYADGMARLAALAALDGPAVNSVCGTRVYSHGARTERVVVLLHGLTNCPAQFDSLARLVYARGSNVIVPRLPRHGMADRMTPELARLEPAELCAFTDRVLDAADGLGAHVDLVGLSLGGTLAAWGAQERADVDRVVLIAPMIGVPTARGPAVFGLTRLLADFPNAFVWWNTHDRERLPGPPQAYPRFATRAVAATLLVAARVRADALRAAPRVRAIELITLAHDPAVDNAAARALVADWRARGRATFRAYEFPGDRGLSHDLVDPRQVGADPAFTYPVFLEALGP